MNLLLSMKQFYLLLILYIVEKISWENTGRRDNLQRTGKNVYSIINKSLILGFEFVVCILEAKNNDDVGNKIN